MICYKCLGNRCEYCKNKGTIYYDDKIESIITNDGTGLFDSYRYLKEYNIFPTSGGLLDQSSKFLLCVKLCDLINFKYKEAKAEQEKALEELKRKQSNG